MIYRPQNIIASLYRRIPHSPALLFAAVFVFFLLFHAFVFRDVIAMIPQIISGDMSVVREELVPFFDIGSQFWGDTTSRLTSSEEVRTSYSFWTAWVRHNAVLPFALVIMNALSASILFYAFHKIGKYVYKDSRFGIIAALLSALLIHTILLYAKAAHFYVLIIGFSMFCLSISLVLEQLYFKAGLEKKNIAAVSLLTLFNPAIHYHVLFYAAVFFIIIVQLLFTVIMSRRVFIKYLKRGAIYFGWLILLSLIPYIIYISLSTPSSIDSVSTNIPVNYWMIYYASLGLPFILSLDTAGHLDLIRHGNYLVSIPRFGSLIVPVLIVWLFISKKWIQKSIAQKLLLLSLLIVMLFSIWMTIGYSDNSPYSFHKAFGYIAILLDTSAGDIGSFIAKTMGTFINVLRFPHRFQFVYYYSVGVLFMVALVYLKSTLQTKMKTIVASSLVVMVALLPIAANSDYRTAVTSGDLASFATPFRVPDDLKNIKQILKERQTPGKLLILPTLESGREIEQDGRRYSFLDKYLIFYLNQPTFYYGVGADTQNKLVAFLAYRAFAYDEPWWQHIVANNIGATDILVPKNVVARGKGTTYLEGIEEKINSQLERSTYYKQVYNGDDFALYRLQEQPSSHTSTLIDMEWKSLLAYLKNEAGETYASYFPLQARQFLKADGDKRLITDSIERSFYDLYISLHPKIAATPHPVSLPFDKKYVASSNFTNNALSLSILYAKNDKYNYLSENVPSLVNLGRPAFTGLTKGQSQLDISLTVPESGAYRIALHGASAADSVAANLEGEEVSLQKIADDQGKSDDHIDFTYFTLDRTLHKGQQTIQIKNTDQNAVLIDSITLIPTSELPKDQTGTSSIRFTEIGKGEYRVVVEEGGSRE